VQVSLEAMRNALVKEAIDFSEAVQRAAPQGALAPAAPADAGRAARARVVSVASRGEVEIARAEARRHLRLYLVAGLAVLAAVGFHGYGWVRARQAASDDAPSRSGVPANAVVSAPPISSAPIVVRKKDGSGFTPDELKRMQDEESLKGNDVRETVPGSVLILPKSGEHPARPAEVKP
jgi:hypothetical protein